MSKRFDEDLKKGKEWEEVIKTWLPNHLGSDKWTVVDTRHVHRDKDNDQYPDFELVNNRTGKVHYIDAKTRNMYTVDGKFAYGMDEKLYRSYTNIAAKHNTKVYVVFGNLASDPDNAYVLDVNQPPTKIEYFNNGHGKGLAYRWHVSDLKKFQIRGNNENT